MNGSERSRMRMFGNKSGEMCVELCVYTQSCYFAYAHGGIQHNNLHMLLQYKEYTKSLLACKYVYINQITKSMCVYTLRSLMLLILDSILVFVMQWFVCLTRINSQAPGPNNNQPIGTKCNFNVIHNPLL